METLLQSSNLIRRAYWLIRLRWMAVVFLVAAVMAANFLFSITLPLNKLLILAGGIVIYNYLLYDLLKHNLTWKGKRPSTHIVENVISFQISADFFILTLILHFSGGIENPFYFYFVFHTIIASILLTKMQSYLQATLGIFLFGLLIFLEYKGYIPHYTLEGYVKHNMYKDGSNIVGTFAVFSSTLYLVVYMTTSICELLRKQQDNFERANKLLKEKDHLKNEYVLRLTHDIKGHIAAIQSCLGIVDDQMVGPLNEKQADLVERAYRRANKCMTFITALLKLTRMKLTGRIDKQYFSLKNTFFNALATVENRASKKLIKVQYEIEGDFDEIFGEPFLIEETITNLLFNAIKYTPQKGHVKLRGIDKGDRVLFEVIDNGIGIPEEELGNIFDEFYRAENARKIERDGTGLGLSIAKQVVQRHGGTITVKNNQNAGCTFSFSLPKAEQKTSTKTGR